MCGITGLIDRKEFSKNLLEKMTEVISYRGPDAQGIYHKQSAGLTIGLGQRRLAIVDLSTTGNQPMSNYEETIWITFNGEIYNFQEIKSQLSDKYSFRTKTDTEVLIYAYQKYGIDFINHLNGMFAFAIWDLRKKKLLLVRDRLGQKPLYYWQKASGIAFSSELKPLTLHPDFKKEVDPVSLSYYLNFEYCPSDSSIYKGVKKLEAGHYLEINFQSNPPKYELHKYWQQDFQKYDFSRASEEEVLTKLHKLYINSIERRLMSDVPLGVFLSGGVDSSSILAMLAEFKEMSTIKTFAIGFQEKSFNETGYAKKVADYFGTEHHEQILKPGKMLEILPDISFNLAEPMADPSIIPTYLLSQFTKEKVTVALGGDGGDELFGGYDTFLANYYANIYQNIPKFCHYNIIQPLAKMLPVSEKNMSFDFKLKHFLKGAFNQTLKRNQIWLSSFNNHEQKLLFSGKVLKEIKNLDSFTPMQSLFENKSYRNDWDKLLCYYQNFYLREAILAKVDRASMFNSLEVRAPFLDYKLVEFVNSLPFHYKFKNRERKYLLKKMLKNKLPHNIIYRKKKGFGIPLTKWIKDDLRQEILDTLDVKKLGMEGFFNPDYVQKILSDHFHKRLDNKKKIWTLYIFEKWLLNNYY